MGKLAITGGEKIALDLEKNIPSWPLIGADAKENLLEVLESKRWCRIYPGSMVEKFEKGFSRYHDARYVIATANGTVSLQLGLRTMGVRYGDEVIVPAVTFIATVSAVTELGAIPVFADIDLETGCIDKHSVESLITPRTKGVIGVHYGGYPIDFDALLPLVKEYDLFLLEDAAHAQGTEWKGRKVGTIGDMGSFSFQETKSLASGEGGAVVTDKEELANKAELIHNIGRVLGKPGYIHYVLSSNYRLSEFLGALLLSQLKKLPQETETKFQNGIFLGNQLRNIGGLLPLRQDNRVTKRGYYFFVLRYQKEVFGEIDRNKFLRALNAEGVPSGVGYGFPLYKNPAFKRENLKPLYAKGTKLPDFESLSLPNSERFCNEQILIPHQVLLAERKYLCLIPEAVRKIKENIDELRRAS